MFGANIVGVLAFILTILRIFSIYAILTFAICIAIAFIANTILIIDILKFKQLNKSTN